MYIRITSLHTLTIENQHISKNTIKFITLQKCYKCGHWHSHVMSCCPNRQYIIMTHIRLVSHIKTTRKLDNFTICLFVSEKNLSLRTDCPSSLSNGIFVVCFYSVHEKFEILWLINQFKVNGWTHPFNCIVTIENLLIFKNNQQMSTITNITNVDNDINMPGAGSYSIELIIIGYDELYNVFNTIRKYDPTMHIVYEIVFCGFWKS